VQNLNGGIITAENTVLDVTRSAFTENKYGNGVLVKDNTTANIGSSYFRHNGLTYGLSAGLNGIELMFNYAGACTISSNTFFDSTAFGIFISGSSQTAIIRSNYFDHSNLSNVHRVAIGMNGALNENNTYNPATVSRATIQGNNFFVPVNSAQQEAIFMLGSGASATIGGTTSTTINVFRNFLGNNVIDPSDTGGGLPNNLGCPTILNDAERENAFVNCGTPVIRPC
jgi:hypothetical protein